MCYLFIYPAICDPLARVGCGPVAPDKAGRGGCGGAGGSGGAWPRWYIRVGPAPPVGAVQTVSGFGFIAPGILPAGLDTVLTGSDTRRNHCGVTSNVLHWHSPC